MRNLHGFCWVCLLLTLSLLSPLAQADFWETDLPWQNELVPDADTIGLWQFKQGQELQDSSGNGLHLSLKGSATTGVDGKFGAGLQCLRHGDEPQKNSAAVCKDADILTPAGAFTVELWVKPSADFFQQSLVFLVDKKYFHYATDREGANWDYMFYCRQNSQQKDEYLLTVSLGFGSDSVWATSSYLSFVADTWYHLAFTYDGQGLVTFYRNAEHVGEASFPGRQGVANGTHGLSIGDRHGSIFYPFPGVIDEVRLSSRIRTFQDGRVTLTNDSERTAFYRQEVEPRLSVVISNGTSAPISQIQGEATSDTTTQSLALYLVQPGENVVIPISLDNNLRPGSYTMDIKLQGQWQEQKKQLALTIPYDIVARPAPAMPVVMWGNGDIERLKDIGFTHNMRTFGQMQQVWQERKPLNLSALADVQREKKGLNEMLANEIQVVIAASPGRWLGRLLNKYPEYRRLDRNGTPLDTENAAVAHRDVQQFGYNIGNTVRQTYGNFPNFTSSLVQTEVRDSTQVSFTPFEVEAAEKYLDGKIPANIASKSGIHYSTIAGFPQNRVVADDDPILKFYTWFWKRGDGWNPMHTMMHRGLKMQTEAGMSSQQTQPDTIKPFWTFYDPAVRVPPVWGSGGNVDVISQWTYSYPDPIKVGQAADELFAMAAGNPGQQVMKMTQIIWYRSRSAPNLPEKEEDRVQWEKDIPDAKFITISPTHLSEALWSKISRPVRGIMYHGWGSLFPMPSGSYQHTNAETAQTLKKLVHEVIQPLGPTLLALPELPADIALLESFSSQVFAGRGTTGWSRGWVADMHLALQWAGLQPDIIYDENILRDDLKQYKILVMPHCDVLTESVVARVKTFQRLGGIVVGDEHLCPAILPDILLSAYQRKDIPHEDKAALQLLGAELSAQLAPFYHRLVFTDNQDIVPRLRRFGRSDYVFTINDHRTYGDYVGHHRLIMEQGLPSRGAITVSRGGFAYDLVKHELVGSAPKGKTLVLEQQYAPGEGKLHMVCDVKLEKITARLRPELPKRGGKAQVFVWVSNKRNQQPSAVIPLAVDIIDPAGRKAEFSGYHVAHHGNLQFNLNFASNDLPGKWRLEAKDLASGNKTKYAFTLE